MIFDNILKIMDLKNKPSTRYDCGNIAVTPDNILRILMICGCLMVCLIMFIIYVYNL